MFIFSYAASVYPLLSEPFRVSCNVLTSQEVMAEAPSIDIDTISKELLEVQQEAQAEMKAAKTLQVRYRQYSCVVLLALRSGHVMQQST